MTELTKAERHLHNVLRLVLKSAPTLREETEVIHALAFLAPKFFPNNTATVKFAEECRLKEKEAANALFDRHISEELARIKKIQRETIPFPGVGRMAPARPCDPVPEPWKPFRPDGSNYCSRCGIDISGPLGYSCPHHPCPSGLGPL